MKTPRLCASIVSTDMKAIHAVEPFVDLFEVRIDVIGEGWEDVVRRLTKPWIATNRLIGEGGKWQGNEARRIEKLLQAIELGAQIVDVEYNARNVDNIISFIKKRATCLLSFHDFEKTPPYESLRSIVRKQLKAGADICKVVTTARSYDDNLLLLQLVSEFRANRIVAFAMGAPGVLSRVLAPLAGADFTYGSVEKVRESAPGQLPVVDMYKMYETLHG